MASETLSKCAICSQPASNICGRCRIQVYCSTVCQKIDWEKHKSPCKVAHLEKILGRVATIIHEAYLHFREKTWDTPIKKIQDNSEGLVIYDGDQAPNLKYFVDFPHGLIHSEKTKMAVLWFPLTVEEVEVNLRKIPRKITAVHPDGYREDNWPNYSHFLLRVAHDKKTKWVPDIAGGQFSIYTPFWKWDDYVNTFVDTKKPIKIYPSGANKSVLHELGKLDGNPSLAYGLVGDIAKAVDEAVAAFEEGHNLKLGALLLLTDRDHNIQKTALLTAIDVAIDTYKRVKDSKIRGDCLTARRYETKHPGLSTAKCQQGFEQYFAQRLNTIE